MNAIDSLLPRARQRLLSILLLHPKQEFYLRELIRMSGVGQGAVQRELASLVKAELIFRRKDGNRVYYRANMESPIYAEIRGLMLKTAGLADVLRTALKQIADEINFAFIYGSIARGEERARSDIDLMIIGEVAFRRVSTLIGPVQDRLGREINPTVYTRDEFVRKLKDGHHFCRSIIKERKLFIVGEENEFKKLASSGMAG